MSAAETKHDRLLQCETLREFLYLALRQQYERQGRVNLADFSRRAGFASRSFLGELLDGKKRLSAESLGKIKSALKLPRGYLRYLEILVYREQPELAPRSFQGQDLAQVIAAQRIRIRLEDRKKKEVSDVGSLVKRPLAFRVFAATGTPDEGATLAEIGSKTKLSAQEIEQALLFLLSQGAVRSSGGRVYPSATSFDFLGLDEPESLAGLVSQVTTDLQKRARAIAENENDFLFYSAVSISKSQLPAFKAKMREALLVNLDQFQRDDGEDVVQVFFSSWR